MCPVEVFVESPIDVARFQPEDYNGLLAEVHKTIERRFDGQQPARDASSAVPIGTS